MSNSNGYWGSVLSVPWMEEETSKSVFERLTAEVLKPKPRTTYLGHVIRRDNV